MNKVFAPVLGLALASCSTVAPSMANVTGDENAVTIGPVLDVAQAQPQADRFCEQYRKKARFDRTEGFTIRFECVAPAESSPDAPAPH